MATAFIFASPLDNTGDQWEVLPGQTIDAWLTASDLWRLLRTLPTVVKVNQRELCEKDYHYVIQEGDIITLYSLPRGGAVFVILTTLFATFAAVKVLQKALELLVPEPEIPGLDQPVGSPTYSVTSRINMARFDQPKPVLYGKMRLWPDLSAKPHSEFYNNEQYLYQIFEVTQGVCEIDTASLCFENTPLDHFDDADVEIIPPGETSDLYPQAFYDVAPVANAEFTNTNFLGPYVAVPIAEHATELIFDMVAAGGLMKTDDDGDAKTWTVEVEFQARPIDDAGTPTGAWVTLSDINNPGPYKLSANSRTPIRRTFKFAVASARYEIRARRVTAVQTEVRYSDSVTWQKAWAKLTDTTGITTTTRVAVKIRASEQIAGGVVNKFNLVAERKLYTWSSGAGWSSQPTLTRNPVWAFVDALREFYGGGRTDSQIDLFGLTALANTLTAEGVECHGVFDTKITLWDALTQIARTCAAMPLDDGGKYRLVRDVQTLTPVQMFTHRNIVAGSLEIHGAAVSAETSDAVLVEYYDATKNYQLDTVLCAITGSPATNPRSVRLWGTTNRDAAFLRGMELIAQNRYRRQRIKWKTGLEGRIPGFYDAVTLSHFLIGRENAAQISGDVLSFNNLDTVTVSEDLANILATPYIIFRKKTGDLTPAYSCTITLPSTVKINEAFDSSSLIWTPGKEAPQFMLGEGTEFFAKVKVIRREIVDETTVELEGFVDDPDYYTAAGGLSPAPSTIPVVTGSTIPVVTDLQYAIDGSINAPVVYFAWKAARADYFILQYSTDAGVTWVTLAERYTRTEYELQGVTIDTAILFRVAGVNIYRGDWKSVSLIVARTALYKPAPVTNLQLSESFTGSEFKIKWDSLGAARWKVQLLTANTVKYYELVSERKFSIHANVALEYGLTRVMKVRVFAVSKDGVESNYVEITATNPAPPLLNNVTLTPIRNTVHVNFDYPTAADFGGVSIWASTSSGFIANDNSLVVDRSLDPVIGFTIEIGQTLYCKTAATDLWGFDAANLNISGETTVVYQKIDTVEITENSITTPLLAANSVTADKISVNQLSAISANMGSLTAGSIKINRQSGWKIELDSTSALPFWFGTGDKNETNGRFYLKDDGTLVIKNASGNPVLYSGSSIPWSSITGGTKPADNATVGATWGNNVAGQPSDAAILNINQLWSQVSGAGKPANYADVTGNNIALGILAQGDFATLDQITGGNISTYIASAAIGGAYIAAAAIGTAHIQQAAVTTLKIAGNAVIVPIYSATAYVQVPSSDNYGEWPTTSSGMTLIDTINLTVPPSVGSVHFIVSSKFEFTDTDNSYTQSHQGIENFLKQFLIPYGQDDSGETNYYDHLRIVLLMEIYHNGVLLDTFFHTHWKVAAISGGLLLADKIITNNTAASQQLIVKNYTRQGSEITMQCRTKTLLQLVQR